MLVAWGAINASRSEHRPRAGQVPDPLRAAREQERLPPVRRPGARLAGRGLQGSRRELLGAAAWARLKPELGGTGAQGAAPLPLERPARRARPSTRTGRTASTGTCSAGSRYDGVGVYGFRATGRRRPARQLRPQHLRRHLQLRVRQGLAPREQLPHPPRGPARSVTSVTASSRTAASAGPGHASTARPPRGPGVTPDVMWAANDTGRFDTPRRHRCRRWSGAGRPEVPYLSVSRVGKRLDPGVKNTRSGDAEAGRRADPGSAKGCTAARPPQRRRNPPGLRDPRIPEWGMPACPAATKLSSERFPAPRSRRSLRDHHDPRPTRAHSTEGGI